MISSKEICKTVFMFLETFHPAVSHEYSYNYLIRIFVKTKINHNDQKRPP